MSLLRHDSSQIDVASRGEELTKGTGHPILATVFAAVVVSLAIAAYFIAGLKPPVITGEVEKVWVHPQHTESSGFDANGESMTKESFDQVYVFAQVKLHNQSNNPLYLHSIMTNATLDDGIHSSYAASAGDYDRVFLAINPGQTVEGTIVSAFRVNEAEWEARKNLDFTFGIQYQPSLTLAPHAAVIVQ